ncbi:MAG: hypothetical protein ACI8RA_001729 [Chlamydiales bacterium]|jgi:hypothetical protein
MMTVSVLGQYSHSLSGVETNEISPQTISCKRLGKLSLLIAGITSCIFLGELVHLFN